MITREIKEWMQKVERGQYSYEDAMYLFQSFIPYLTRDEMKLIQNKLKESYRT